jgi:hypothetical protein
MATKEVLNNVPGLAAPKEIDAKTSTDAEKLEAGWRTVEIPDKDPYDYVFQGIYLNNLHFKPGKHLVHPDIAAALEERLVAFAKYNTRLMRPQADLTSLSQVPGAR